MRRALAFILVLAAGLILGATGPEVFKSPVYIGNTATYIQRNGADLKFVDGSNPSGKTLTQLAATGGGTGGVPGAGGLRAFNDATTPDSQLGVTAEWMSLVSEDKSTTVLATTVSVTFNIATDLDTGVSESANTFYYCWLSSTDGTNFTRKMTTSPDDVADILATTPRLRVAWILNDASSNFRRLRRENDRTIYQHDWTNVLNSTATQSGSWGSVSLSSYLPAICKRGFGSWAVYDAGGSTNNFMMVVFAADDQGAAATLNLSTLSAIGFGSQRASDPGPFEVRGLWDFEFKTDRTIYFRTDVHPPDGYRAWVGGGYDGVDF